MYPEKIVRILENAYKNTFSSVKVCRELSDQFKTIVGVLQGCVLSPILFNIFLELIIVTAREGEEIGGVRINNLHFANDTALLTENSNELQAMVHRVV